MYIWSILLWKCVELCWIVLNLHIHLSPFFFLRGALRVDTCLGILLICVQSNQCYDPVQHICQRRRGILITYEDTCCKFMSVHICQEGWWTLILHECWRWSMFVWPSRTHVILFAMGKGRNMFSEMPLVTTCLVRPPSQPVKREARERSDIICEAQQLFLPSTLT